MDPWQLRPQICYADILALQISMSIIRILFNSITITNTICLKLKLYCTIAVDADASRGRNYVEARKALAAFGRVVL